MARTVLLLGRKDIVVDEIRQNLALKDVTLLSGTSLEDVHNVFETRSVDVVIMGAGLDLDVRVNIVKHIFTVSTATPVHMKDWDSGPQGMLPFVDAVLRGLLR